MSERKIERETKNTKRAIDKEASIRKRKKQKEKKVVNTNKKLPKVTADQVSFKELLKQTVSPVAHVARPIINYQRRKEAERINKERGYKQGGKLKSKFFTGGTVNPSFGGEFDDR